MAKDDDFEWDDAKSARNAHVRGFGFELVHDFDFAAARIITDGRKDYGEARFRAVGRIGGRPYMVVFTPRGSRLRIISMRRMHEKEARRYGV